MPSPAFSRRRLGVPPDPRALGRRVALTIGALVGVIFLIAPAVASQVQDLVANLPQFLAELDQSINRLLRSIPVLRRGVSRGHRTRPPRHLAQRAGRGAARRRGARTSRAESS